MKRSIYALTIALFVALVLTLALSIPAQAKRVKLICLPTPTPAPYNCPPDCGPVPPAVYPTPVCVPR